MVSGQLEVKEARERNRDELSSNAYRYLQPSMSEGKALSKADHQDTAAQVKALRKAGCERIFEEKASRVMSIAERD